MKGCSGGVDAPEARWIVWRLVVAVLVEEDLEERETMVVQWTQMGYLGCWRGSEEGVLPRR